MIAGRERCILIAANPGKNGVREKLLGLIAHMGIAENALRPLRKEGNTSSEDEVIQCSEGQFRQLQNSGVLRDDFIAYEESPDGKLTQIHPEPLKQTVPRHVSSQDRVQRIEDLLAIPTVTRARYIPPPRRRKKLPTA